MPNYESPSLYIDFSRLPPPDVIEEIDYEVLLQRYRADVVAKNPALAKAVGLEQSPTNIILEAETFGEMLVRSRINAAARSVMLAFATGADLDNLAAFHNVIRAQLPVEGSNPVTYVPESDERFRRRIQMATEAYTTCGSEGAYIFHALTADAGIRDASAVRMNDAGGVRVTIMNSGANPVPTEEQIAAVVKRLNLKTIKPLTDVVSVAPVTVTDVALVANVTLYPGPDASLVLADINKALQSVRNRTSLIGRDLNRSMLIAALNQEGVQQVELVSPATDTVVGTGGCVRITSATINVSGNRAE